MKRALTILALLLAPVAAFAQQSGSLNFGQGILTYQFTHDPQTNRVTVVIGVTANSPWYAEWGVLIGEQGQSPVQGVQPLAGWGGAAGTYSFNGTAGALLTILANGRNGANGQGTASVSAQWRIGEPDKKVTVALRNDRDVQVIYKLLQNGVVIGQVTLQPGEGLIQTFNAPSGADVTVVERVEGVGFDGTSWVAAQGAVTEKPVGTVPPHPANTPPSTPPAIPQSPDIPKKVSPTPPPPDSPVWGPATPPAAQSDLLSGKDFRAGVDKLVAGQAGIANTVASASSSAAARDAARDAKLEGIASKLDVSNTKAGEGNAHLEAIKTNTGATASKLDAITAKLDELKQADDYDTRSSAAQTAAQNSYTQAQSQGSSSSSSASSSVSSKSTPSLSDSGGGTVGWVIPLGRHGTLPLNFAADFDGLATFVRTVIAWFVLGVFNWWLWKEFQTLLQTAALAPQSRGNAIFGGTGGQATALVAAAAITALLIALPAAYWAVAEGAGGGSVFGGNPLAGAGAYGVGLLYYFVPVSTILSCVAGAFVVRKAGLALLMGVAAAIRFVVP